VPAPQIRSTILALYKLVCMYVCMYVCTELDQSVIIRLRSADRLPQRRTDSKILLFVFLYLIFRMNDCMIVIQPPVCNTSIKRFDLK